jgi:segregation and condensation protein B
MSLKAKIEAVIYASEEPVTLAQLSSLLGEEAQAELAAQTPEQPQLELETEATEKPAADEKAPEADEKAPAADEKKLARDRERRLRDYLRTLLDQLIAEYADGDRGLEIREVAGGYRLATRPEYHDTVRGFVKALKPPLKLTLQALETLAVIAYKQPVTAPEISEIRGVDTSGVLGSLLLRKLITTAGRKQVIGRPILYKTTKDFLVRFGLKDVNELPSIEEFEKMAGELNEAVQEEMDMGSDTSASDTDADNGMRAEDEPSQNVADEAIVDGRISSLDPVYDEDNPSAMEAEIQSSEKG